MTFVISPPNRVSLGVVGTLARFPVRRVYCIGRNYVEHIREIPDADERELPFFFQKPTDAILEDGGAFPYPPATQNVHHEVELAVAISKSGENITVGNALNHVFGYGVGIDMTRRDLQAIAKEMRRPWEAAKAYDCSAPCSNIVPAKEIGHPTCGRIWLEVNGVVKQDGDLEQQIWSVQESIAYIATMFKLMPGDLIMTGTPAGVGPVKKGDNIMGAIDGISKVRVSVK